MPESRRYYSARTGREPAAARATLEMLQRLVLVTFRDLMDRGYFDEFLGFGCVDRDFRPGRGGKDVGAYVFRKTRKAHLWPIPEVGERQLTESDLFDLVEFLHDEVSKPTKGTLHEFNDCGMHWEEFDQASGCAEFRDEVNPFLRDYGTGWRLSESGEVAQLAPSGLERLLDAPLRRVDSRAVSARVDAARRKFLARGATPDDRRDAIRDLGDVLEFLRPQMKAVLTRADEGDLFNLANKFGIRHHNDKQRTDYDEDIWFSWMFYYYLATIHAATRLIERKARLSVQATTSPR